MVLNVLLKMKTRIYATPAVKGLTLLSLIKTLSVFNPLFKRSLLVEMNHNLLKSKHEYCFNIFASRLKRNC